MNYSPAQGSETRSGDSPNASIDARVQLLLDAISRVADRQSVPGLFRVGQLVACAVDGAGSDGALMAAQLGVRLSERTLARARRIFDVGTHCPELVTRRDLSYSHVLVLASLSSADRGRLLQQTTNEGLSVRQLKSILRGLRIVPPRTGRPRTAPIVKTLAMLSEPDVFAGVETLFSLRPQAASELLARCRSAQSELKRVESALQQSSEQRLGARVLLVDSDRPFARRAQRLLRGDSYTVIVADSCADALARIEGRIACAILNVYLRDGCGYELSKCLVARAPHLRCLFLASASHDELPAHLRGLEPLVYKDSRLIRIREAVAKAMTPSFSVCT